MAKTVHLKVDKRWCAKCRICAKVTDNTIQFDDSGYPSEIAYTEKDIDVVKVGVAKCPAKVLSLE